MFEGLEERRRSRSRSIALMLGIGTTAMVVAVKLLLWHAGAEVERDIAERHAALAGESSPTSHTYAGLTIELPGPAAIVDADRYQMGSLVGGRPFEYSLLWQPGVVADARLREITVRRAFDIAGLPFTTLPVPTLRTVAGSAAYEYALEGFPTRANPVGNRRTYWLTLFECDGRLFTLFADGNGGREGNDKLLQSARCTPDPKVHDAASEAPVIVDAESGWKRVAVPDELALVGPSGLHLHARLFKRTADGGTVADVIRAAATDIQLRGEPTTRGDKVFFTGWMSVGSGETREVAVLGFRCPGDDIGTVTIIGKPPLDQGILLGDSGRCRGAGEPMPAYER